MPKLSPDASEVSPALTLFSTVVRHMAHWATTWLTVRTPSTSVTAIDRIMFFIPSLFDIVQQYPHFRYQSVYLFLLRSVIIATYLPCSIY